MSDVWHRMRANPFAAMLDQVASTVHAAAAAALQPIHKELHHMALNLDKLEADVGRVKDGVAQLRQQITDLSTANSDTSLQPRIDAIDSTLASLFPQDGTTQPATEQPPPAPLPPVTGQPSPTP